MGTNYYSVKRGFDYESIDSFWDVRGTEDCIHIGKSSGGWCFSLHVVPEMGINTYEDWVRMFIDPDRIIMDEYGDVVPFTAMISKITARRGNINKPPTPEFLENNHAEPGPHGLVRHRIEFFEDGGCVGHGEGTYDYISGDFS